MCQRYKYSRSILSNGSIDMASDYDLVYENDIRYIEEINRPCGHMQ